MTEITSNSPINNRYVPVTRIGIGPCSETWLVNDNISRSQAVLKCYYSADRATADLTVERFTSIIDMRYGGIITPRIIDMYVDRPFTVTRIYPNGSLDRAAGRIDEDALWRCILQVSTALEYLHGLPAPVMHLNIKPSNILIDEYGSFMLSDFGMGTRLAATVMQQCGTHPSPNYTAYTAPETVNGDTDGIKATDIWAFGATLYTLVSGQPPFGALGGAMQNGGTPVPSLNPGWSATLNDLIRRCLDIEPWNRPTAAQIKVVAQQRGAGMEATVGPQPVDYAAPATPEMPYTPTPAAPSTSFTPAPAAPSTPFTHAPAAPSSPFTPAQPSPSTPFTPAPAAPSTPFTPAQPAPSSPFTPNQPAPSSPFSSAPAAPSTPFPPSNQPMPGAPFPPAAGPAGSPAGNSYGYPSNQPAPQFTPEPAGINLSKSGPAAGPQNQDFHSPQGGYTPGGYPQQRPFDSSAARGAAAPATPARRPWESDDKARRFEPNKKYTSRSKQKASTLEKIIDIIEKYRTLLIIVALLLILCIGLLIYKRHHTVAEVRTGPVENVMETEETPSESPDIESVMTIVDNEDEQKTTEYNGIKTPPPMTPGRQFPKELPLHPTLGQEPRSSSGGNDGATAENSSSKTQKDAPTGNAAKLADALSRNDYDAVIGMAENGYPAANGELAMYYLRSRQYSEADHYARKAKAGGDAKGAKVMSVLEQMGFYDE